MKCSKILAHIELLYNPRVNKVFTIKYSLVSVQSKVTLQKEYEKLVDFIDLKNI